jgi:hypothetical protein
MLCVFCLPQIAYVLMAKLPYELLLLQMHGIPVSDSTRCPVKHLHVIEENGLPVDSVRLEQTDFGWLKALCRQPVIQEIVLLASFEHDLIVIFEVLEDVQLHFPANFGTLLHSPTIVGQQALLWELPPINGVLALPN